MDHAQHTQPGDQHGGHSGHGWMMIVWCIPMLVIAIVLVATGVAGAGFIFAAVVCTAMMAMMMGMMGGMGGKGGERRLDSPAGTNCARIYSDNWTPPWDRVASCIPVSASIQRRLLLFA